jgi:photosystem II stability/assembly factor-like uncharacterized protein
MRRSRFSPVTFALLALAAPLSAQVLDSATVNGFRWRTVGPANFMGRISDIVGIPGPSKTWFVAAAAGGIWKTTNNGLTWRPLFDDKRVISMGALAIARTDTQQVWAGTGEPHTRNSIEPGGGLYKSNDGGLTWREIPGFEKTQHISVIAVHPTNANIVFVAALGAVWGPNADRGLYKTTDGGQTWRRVKFISDKAGFIDVAIDPRNPNTIWAASWQVYRTPYSLFSGGVGSALWKSTDGGENWTEIKGGGYPQGIKGRIGIGIAPSNPDIVYAITEAHSMDPQTTMEGPQRANGLYRTTDGGRTWEKMNSVNTRPFYYSKVAVDPKNPDRVYYSSTPVHFSNDGGRTDLMEDQGRLHVDTHGFWIDPNDPERWGQATDGGPAITFDKGGNFFYPMNIPVAQFYEVSFDMAVPYNICGGAQDNGSWCGPSRRASGDMNNSYWFTVSGGDGFYTAQDPTDPNWVWSESQGGNASARNLKTGERIAITKPSWQARYRELEDSIALARGNPLVAITPTQRARIDNLRAQQRQDSIDLTMRYNWNSPFFLSPHNPRVFYFAGNRVLKSVNRGEGLFPISPDLSKAVMPQYRTVFQARLDTAVRLTGGITTDATGAEMYGTVVSLAESYVKPGLLFAGTDDGNVWKTHNDGANWEPLMGRFPGVPFDAYVTKIEPSHFDTLTFYVAFDNHRWNDFKPYVYATNDGGKSFRSISNNLPAASPADFVHVIREDPINRDLLFVGTSIGVYASVDRGASWTRFSPGMPSVPVYDLKIHPRDRELIAATHGRGFWIVDIAALQQVTPRAMAAPATLFAPRTAFQWSEPPVVGIPGNGHGSQSFTMPAPPYGASIFYRLREAATGPVNIAVSDGTGETIFQTAGPSRAGVNWVLWPFSVTRAPVPVDPPPQSPSARRDSILMFVRAPSVLDSLTAAKYDSAAIASVRNTVAQATAAATGRGAGAGAGRGGLPAGGGGGGGGGAGGRGGVLPASAACDHPLTIWDTFCPRPIEATPAGGRGGGGGGGAGGAAAAPPPAAPAGRGGAPAGRGAAPAAPAVDPVRRIWDIIGMNPPAGAGGAGGRGGGGGGGGGRGGAGGAIAQPGTYLVTMTVNGQTYRQTFRVERP